MFCRNINEIWSPHIYTRLDIDFKVFNIIRYNRIAALTKSQNPKFTKQTRAMYSWKVPADVRVFLQAKRIIRSVEIHLDTRCTCYPRKITDVRESVPGFINLVRCKARWWNDISPTSSWKTRSSKGKLTRAEFLLWQQGYLFTFLPTFALPSLSLSLDFPSPSLSSSVTFSFRTTSSVTPRMIGYK